jgi:hypothetical protein
MHNVGAVLTPQGQTLPSRELNQGGTSTAAQQFKDPGVSAYPPLAIQVPADGKFKNKAMLIRAWGRVEGGTTTNFTIGLYWGKSATVANNTLLEASTARAVNSAKAPWMIEALVVWDDDAQKLQGFGRSMVNNLFDAEAALNNAISSVDPDGGATTYGLTLCGTFSSGNAGNKAYVDGFELVEL